MSDPKEWEGLTESTKKLFRLEEENKALQSQNERLIKVLEIFYHAVKDHNLVAASFGAAAMINNLQKESKALLKP